MWLAASLALALGLQDDVSALLEHLRGDDLARREAAQRALERKGLEALEPLKAAALKETDLETKIRLRQLIEKIPKLAQLAKVYGPARRATLRYKDEEVRVVLENLGGIYQEAIRNEGIEAGARISLDLPEATLWEALDQVARRAKMHYLYRKDGITFLPGEAPGFPAVYYDQFRISVAEVKRVEFRSPDDKRHTAVLMLEVAHPRRLTPTGDRYRDVFAIDSIQTAAGRDAQTKVPWWANFGVVARRDYALEENWFLDAGAGPVTVVGKATVNFAQEHREISLALDGERKEESTADGTFRVADVQPEDGKTIVHLEIEIADADGPDRRFRGIWVMDPEGRRHPGKILRTGRDGKSFKPKLWFPIPPEQAKTLVFKWAMGIHSIAIPFELRDIQIP